MPTLPLFIRMPDQSTLLQSESPLVVLLLEQSTEQLTKDICPPFSRWQAVGVTLHCQHVIGEHALVWTRTFCLLDPGRDCPCRS